MSQRQDSRQPSSTGEQRTMSGGFQQPNDQSFFSNETQRSYGSYEHQSSQSLRSAAPQCNNGPPQQLSDSEPHSSLSSLVFELQSLEKQPSKAPPSNVDQGPLMGRGDDQDSMMFADIKQLTENPPDASVLHHSESYPVMRHSPYNHAQLADQYGAGPPQSRRSIPTPAPRHSRSLSGQSHQTAIQNTLTDDTLANPSMSHDQFNTQVHAGRLSQKQATHGGNAGVTPALNQAERFQIIAQNQSPANQPPPFQDARPKTYNKPTTQSPAYRPPAEQQPSGSQYGQIQTGAQSLRLDMEAAKSPKISPRPQQGVPSTASPSRVPSSTSPAEKPKFMSLQNNPTANRLNEEDALNKFKLHYAKAQIKAKDSSKTDETYHEYCMALMYEMQARGENNIEIGKTQRIIGRLCASRGRHKEAIDHLEAAKRIYRQSRGADSDSESWWRLHDELAQAYSKGDNSAKEIENYEEAIRIVEVSGDASERLPHMHYNVGVEYYQQDDLMNAERHLIKAKDMMTIIAAGEEDEDLAKVHNVLGKTYKKQGRQREAAEELQTFIRIQKKINPDSKGSLLSAPAHSELADIFEKLEKPEQAAEHKAMAESILGNIGNDDGDGQALQQNLEALALGAGMGDMLTAGVSSQEDIQKGQRHYQQGNTQLAIQSYESAIGKINSLPAELKNTEDIMSQLAAIHNNTGNAYRSISRHEEARDHIEKSLNLRRRLYADEPNEDLVSSLYNLGFLLAQHGDVGNLVRSVELHEEAAETYRKLGGANKNREFLKYMVDIHQSLGLRYDKLGTLSKSLEHYEKAKQLIHDHTGNHRDLQSICNNAGNTYQKNKEFRKAEENFQTSEALAGMMCQENPDDPGLQNCLAAVKNNLGCLYQAMEKHDKALEHHQASLEIRQRIAEFNAEALTDIPGNLHNMGNTLTSLGRYREATTYYSQAEKAKRDLGEDVTDVLISLSNAYSKSGDSEMAEQVLNRI